MKLFTHTIKGPAEFISPMCHAYTVLTFNLMNRKIDYSVSHHDDTIYFIEVVPESELEVIQNIWDTILEQKKLGWETNGVTYTQDIQNAFDPR